MSWELALGIYGAILSTALAAREIWTHRRNVRITSVRAYNSANFNPPGSFLRITVANHRAASVFVRTAFLQKRLKRSRLLGQIRHAIYYRRFERSGAIQEALPIDTVYTPALPTAIEPGRSLVIWIPWDKIEVAMEDGQPVRLAIQDELDRTLVGPPLCK